MKISLLRLVSSALLLLTIFSSATFGQFFEHYPCPGNATFSEDFESGFPTGWQVLDLDGFTPRTPTGLNPGWQLITDYKDSSNMVMASPSWYSLPDTSEDWLITDQITLGNETCVSWWAYAADPFFAESYELRISNTTADTAGFFAEPAVVTINAESGNRSYRSANLSDYAGQSVYLAFRQTSFDKFILVLDDLTTTEYTTMVDIGVDSMVPIEPIATVAYQFSGAVRNYGTDTITAFDISYSIDGGPAKTEVFDSIILPPNYGFFFLHDSLFISSSEDTYSFCIWSENPNLSIDDDANNDTLCTTFTVSPFVGIEPETDFNTFFRVWPNPATTRLHIDTRLPNPRDWELSLLTLEGREIDRLAMVPSGPTEMDLGSLPSGMYLLRGRSDAGTWHRKIIKY